MRYDESDRESQNVEDRRSEGGMAPPGGRFPFPMPSGGGGMSLTTLVIVGAVMLLFGINPLELLNSPGMSGLPQMPRMDPGPGRQSGYPVPRNGQRSPFEVPGLPAPHAGTPPSSDEMKRFVGRVLADTEEVWGRVFQTFGKRYEPTKLVLFTGATKTACGLGRSAIGPFYCPLDRTVYVDLSFYEELRRRFRAPGDFAQAYVIAHEVGHHVQALLGIAEDVQRLRSRGDQRESNALQVRMELQADCLAGVWANLTHKIKHRLEEGDIEEGLNAAAAIGDDRIQRETQGQVVPETFTHGSSQQRVRWFKRGFDTGQIQTCDTFKAAQL